ncbi:MAG: hypothetical protein AAB537_03130, partial [Patescibacteria group bacterium]
GNVGIGTTNPLEKLSVVGNQLLTGDLSLYGGDFNLGTGFSTTTLTTLNNRLGIGTTSPWALFSLSASSTDQTHTPLFVVSTTSPTASTTAFVIDSQGRVGVGTSTPGTDFAVQGGLLASGVTNLMGHCVTGDTKLRRRRRKKSPFGKGRGPLAVRDFKSSALSGTSFSKGGFEDDDYIYDEVAIKDIEAGDEIQSLDAKTGQLVWHKVKGVAFMGTKPIFKLTTESGKTIRTTAEHPYFVRNLHTEKRLAKKQKLYRFEVDQSVRIEELSRDSVVAVANKEQEFSAIIPRKLKRRLYEATRREGGAVKFFAPRLFAQSIIAILRFAPAIVRELIIDIEYPGYERIIMRTIERAVPGVSVFFKPIGKKSPAHFAAYGVFAGKKKASLVISGRDIAAAILPKTQDGRRTVTPLDESQTIRSPRRSSSGGSIAKQFALSSAPSVDNKNGVWRKVVDIKEGQEIAVVSENSPFEKGRGPLAVRDFSAAWDKIVKIEHLPAEDVYDIEVEGTHNFIGNGIVAHNTYIPDLTVTGSTNYTGAGTTTFAGDIQTTGLSAINYISAPR